MTSKIIKTNETKPEEAPRVRIIKCEALPSIKTIEDTYRETKYEIPARSKVHIVADSKCMPVVVGDFDSRVISFDMVREWHLAVLNEQMTPMTVIILIQ